MFGFMKGFGTVVEEISAEQAHQRMAKKNEVVLLDVRTPAEYEQAHVEGSLLIPVQDLQTQMGQLDKHKNKEILVICRSGNRSYTAAAMLKEKGFEKAFNVSGGVMSWYQAGLPLTSGR
ncbi:MAG: hypothetical protein A2600_04630 [Candidatus Lambdaproteobacteria bacterium RIFOXYD1_FULL_56_27]|uniref:Rhodanese domain-containing protein n=1 Tax=Candidatus Lambdaproteobacteria bacterium RIFOXYD2_FULL_56_26 TaxID=1817773 RepID=A0A1F6H3Y7_9PROT|nr:MAG: hypothetical protein A2426_13695 [Candidatus Lambdaproteobacteria bacterium RIFOXYC1_FULL_56_13]OGH05040.1 MAG: hypothetical protein A2557_08695 [Candidatus Lambdaproteobacteria bacterium RIFOXYD2_FULL_56_26]OGH09505.1 MAG: hypothetical protein A2600_04630 [Candidatus Lambdaproteobacteria bacterium RIFOXYD1_FULL_56_27]